MTLQANQNFDAQLDKFVAGAQDVVNKYFATNFQTSQVPKLLVQPGLRYIKIIRERDAGSRSVHCFIDKTNGNVLKAASWKAPAKHARSNIFDADAGVGGVGQWGGKYLRG